MVTTREIRDILAPVLAAHPDLVLHRRWIIKPPIVTALCGLHIGRTSSARVADILAPDYPVHLLATFNATAKPLLDALTTFENIADWLSRFRQQPLRLTAVERVDAWLATMRGDFAAGANHLEALLQRRAASGLVGTD